MLQCGVCHGKDEKCRACGGWGYTRIEGCPREIVPARVWRTLDLIEHAAKGALPVLAGTLGQCESFADAAGLVWAEESIHKARLKASGHQASSET